MQLPSRMHTALRAAGGGLPRPFWFLWAGVFVTRAGSFVLPFLSLYLIQSLHLSLAEAGLVLGLYGAGGAVAGPLGGYLADHVGRRVTLVSALALGGLGMILLGTAHRVAVIAPGIFATALVTEMYRPAMQAAVADLVGPQDRTRAFGLVYWIINVGFAIGLTIGGLIASRSFFWLFVGDGLTTLGFAALIALGVPETKPARAARPAGARAPHPLQEFLAPYQDRTFVAFGLLGFLFALVFMQSATTFPVDMTAHGMSKAVYGRVLAMNGIVIALVQPFVGPFLARRDRSRSLAAGAVLVGLGFGVNAFARSAGAYALGVLVWTIGEMGVLPIANALVADLAPPDRRARYQGAYGMTFSLAVCTAPASGMLLLDRFGSLGLWSACTAVGLAVAAGQLALAGRVRRLRATRLAMEAEILGAH